ncbi:MAG: 50S ribosome-binding GTPase [Erysipelotrichales bacterium]|nr:50S ribosome-binding GTPase [Erysipelotrichales bacterium]
MNKKCSGCGSLLQTKDSSLVGYLPETVFNEQKNSICQRCFRIKHYNESSVNKKDSFKKVQNVLEKNALFVYICDVLNFDPQFFKSVFQDKKADVIFVVNKADLFKKALKLSKLESYYHQTITKFYPIKQSFLVSALNVYGLNQLKKGLIKEANGRTIYFIGTVSSGKSSLLNRLTESNTLTVSKSPGTTQEFVGLKKGNIKFFDTPGLTNQAEITNYLLPETLNKIIAAKAFRPKAYQLKGEQTIFVGDFFFLSLIEGENINIVFYFSQLLNYHRSKLENTEKNRLKIISKEYSYQEVTIKENKAKSFQINILGLGLIEIFGVCKIKITLPKNVGVVKISE